VSSSTSGVGRAPSPRPGQDYDLDQVAELDLPAALAFIAGATAGQPVQLVGYGMGAAAAFMAVLGGKAPQLSSLVALEAGCFVDASTQLQVAATLGISPIEVYGSGVGAAIAKLIFGSPFGSINADEHSAGVVAELLVVGLPVPERVVGKLEVRRQEAVVEESAAETGAEGEGQLEAGAGDDRRSLDLGVVEHERRPPERLGERGLGVEAAPLLCEHVIDRGEVVWAPKWTPEQVAAGRAGEQARRRAYFDDLDRQRRRGILRRIWLWLRRIWSR